MVIFFICSLVKAVKFILAVPVVLSAGYTVCCLDVFCLKLSNEADSLTERYKQPLRMRVFKGRQRLYFFPL